MENAYSDKSNLTEIHTVLYFNELIGIELPVSEILSKTIGNWNLSFLTNDMRNFLFKLKNNQLPLNNRVNAYDINRDYRCSFCRIIDNNSNTRENFTHLFISCPVTSRLLRGWVSRMEPVPDIESDAFLNLYWYGILDDDQEVNTVGFLGLLFDFFKYAVWKFKLKRQVPNLRLFTDRMLFELLIAMKKNRNFARTLEGINAVANIIPARG